MPVCPINCSEPYSNYTLILIVNAHLWTSLITLLYVKNLTIKN